MKSSRLGRLPISAVVKGGQTERGNEVGNGDGGRKRDRLGVFFHLRKLI